MAKRDIIVIGASAGGVEALTTLTRQLPEDFPAAILAVVHTAPAGPGHLADVVGRDTRLKTCLGQHAQRIIPGHIYIAPPDHHMMANDGQISLSRGPRENRARPAVDPLFRSAAAAYGPRVIGIILTGCLDDGAAGLLAVKRCGGLTMVQDPADAAYPDMPRSAMEVVPIDHALPVADMGSVLGRLTREDVNERFTLPPDVAREVGMGDKDPAETTSDPQALNEWGKMVPVSCPDCGGPIWEHVDGRLRRYRCLIGHAFSSKSLMAEQCDRVETSLWSAVRTLEEHARLLAQLAENEQRNGKDWMTIAEDAGKTRERAQILRSLLT